MGSKNIIIPVGAAAPSGKGYAILQNYKYIETQVPVNLDIAAEGIYYAAQTRGANLVQVLPKHSTVPQGYEIYIELIPDNETDTLTFSPYAGDNLDGTSGNIDFNGKGFKGIIKSFDVGWMWIDLSKAETKTSKIPIFSNGQKITDEAGAFYLEGELEAYANPNLSNTYNIRIKPDTFEEKKPDSYLAYVSDEVKFISKHTDDLWHDGIRKNVGSFIQLDINDKAVGIEEQDFIDPNISDGTHYLVAWSANYEGRAAYDFYITMKLRNKFNNEVILDINGNPCMVTKFFKTGDLIGIMELKSIIRAKGQVFFKCSVESSINTGDFLTLRDSTQGPSELLVQTLLPGAEVSEAMAQYQIDTGNKLNFGKIILEDLFDTNYFFSKDEDVIQQPKSECDLDGAFWNVFNPLRTVIVKGELTIEDQSTPLDFEFGKASNTREAFMLRGKKIVTNTKILNPYSRFAICLLTTNVKNAVIPPRFITKFDGGNIETAKDWYVPAFTIIEKSKTMIDDITTFTLPEDMENFAFVIFPIEKLATNQVEIKQFKFYVDPTINTYFINNGIHGEAYHTMKEDRKLIVCYGIKSNNSTSLRYTINSKDTQMPLGFDKGGDAKVTVIPREGKVFDQETILRFDMEGVAKIQTSFKFYRGEKAIGEEILTLFYAKKNGNNWDKIPESETSTTIHETAKGELSLDMKRFNLKVVSGDIIALFAKTTHDDGAFIQAVGTNDNMIVTNILFDEIV